MLRYLGYREGADAARLPPERWYVYDDSTLPPAAMIRSVIFGTAAHEGTAAALAQLEATGGRAARRFGPRPLLVPPDGSDGGGGDGEAGAA